MVTMSFSLKLDLSFSGYEHINELKLPGLLIFAFDVLLCKLVEEYVLFLKYHIKILKTFLFWTFVEELFLCGSLC